MLSNQPENSFKLPKINRPKFVPKFDNSGSTLSPIRPRPPKLHSKSNAELIQEICSLNNTNIQIEDEIHLVNEYFNNPMHKASREEEDEMKKINIDRLYQSRIGKSHMFDSNKYERVLSFQKNFLMKLYKREIKNMKKNMLKLDKQFKRKSERVSASSKCLDEEKILIKRNEDIFYRNLHTLIDRKRAKMVDPSQKKVVDFEKVMKYFKDELSQKDQRIYKVTFEVQEIKKKIKKQKQKEVQNSVNKNFSAIDFDQLKIENGEMRVKLKRINREIVRLKKRNIKLKQTQNVISNDLTDFTKINQKLWKRAERKENSIKKIKQEIIAIETSKNVERTVNLKLRQKHSEMKPPKTMEYIMLIRNLHDVKNKLISWKRKHAIVASSRKMYFGKLKKLRIARGRRRPMTVGFSNLSSIGMRSRSRAMESEKRSRRNLQSGVSSAYTFSTKSGVSYKTNRTD